MLHYFRTVIILVTILFPVLLPAESLDSLIQKINTRMESHTKNESFICSILSKEMRMDKHWEPEKIKIIEKKMIKNGEDITIQVSRAVEIKDGEEKDITEDVRKEVENSQETVEEKDHDKDKEEGKRTVSLSSDELNPFSNENKSLYTFILLPDTLNFHRIQTTAKEPDDKRFEGIYRINQTTGSIEQMDLHPSKNPRFVKSFNFTLKFSEINETRWVLTYSRVRVYVSLLIKKIRIVTEDAYSDFVFSEEEAGQPSAP